jgi:poly(3-hydroxybutyrate) depolymerase
MKADTRRPPLATKREHSVPWLWPVAAAVEAGEAGLELFKENARFLSEMERVDNPPPPDWATPNRVALDLDTMRLRDFAEKPGAATQVPVLVDAPYAGHSATIADFAPHQSLVRTLMASGLERVLVTDWKSATDAMRNFDIDKYLAELNVAVDELGQPVHLVGLCQGGWLCAMYAARYPRKVRSLVLAGAPIDTDAGDGAVKDIAHDQPMSFFEEIVAMGGGRMLGSFMVAGWKSMHPEQQFFGKYLDLYSHIEDRNYIKRTEAFERWYENPINLPGTFYLQAVKELFRENSLAKGSFVGLGRKLSLSAVTAPAYLLAGDHDDITPSPQVFAAQNLLGTPPHQIVTDVASGGHIGLFMGSRTLTEHWPKIGAWIVEQDHAQQ